MKVSKNGTKGWQRASIYDVAKVAGVSHMTVSRVLNGHPNIRETTRDRVLAAIEETNYTRSSIARALATQRAMRIGVLVDSPVHYGPNSTLRALESSAREHGYAVSAVSFSDDDEAHVDTGIVELVTQGVDGLCMIAPRVSSLDKIRQRAPGLPTLVIQAEPVPDMHTAAVDQLAGARAAVQHLVDLGHERILHLAGPLDWFDSRARLEGWASVLTEAGLPVGEPIVGDWSSDSGYEVGRHGPLDGATAIFASNDQMALGLIHGLSERGLRVPADISVVGFDDLPDARHFLPPLTTVRQDFASLGELVLNLLVAAIEDSPNGDRQLIEPRLIVRESTAPPRATGRLAPGARARRA